MPAQVKAGNLDRRLSLWAAQASDDGFGTVETFAAIGTVWASKRDVSDSERWAAGQVQAHITTRFQVRYSTMTAGMTAQDRVSCEGKTYDIVAVKEIGRREGIEISGAARAD